MNTLKVGWMRGTRFILEIGTTRWIRYDENVF